MSVNTMVQTTSTPAEAISAEEASRKATYENLVRLGGGKITEESGIAYHDGNQIILPRNMKLRKGAKLLLAQAANLEIEHKFQRSFNYRPWDGANALQIALKRIFGVTGQGQAIHTMFGTEPPNYIEIKTGLHETTRVPWGHISFPLLDAVISTGAMVHKVYGQIFHLSITAPKKHEDAINGLFHVIEMVLREESIYKGRAFSGTQEPEFIDPYGVDRRRVVYRTDVFERLEDSVWGPIRTADLQREFGLKLNRKTLLYGPYGTGKTLAGALTAQVAVENEFTFIQCHTGKDNLDEVLQTAQMYAPAVVFLEDINVLLEQDDKEMSKLLEMFDGLSGKGSEVMVLMTSNHVESLSKGMTRAGRIDSAIEIGDLDRAGIERLISVTFEPHQLDPNIDYDEICKSMEGYEPAFIMGTFTSTKSNALVRTQSRDFVLTTSDFVRAAQTMRNQHDTHLAALDKPLTDQFGESFEKVIRSGVQKEFNKHAVDLEEGTGRIQTLDD